MSISADSHPTACLDIDLVPSVEGAGAAEQASRPVDKAAEGGAEVLVRIHGQPLGRVSLEPGVPISRADLLGRLDFRTRTRVTAHLVADGVAAASIRTDEATLAALDGVAGGACFTAPARTSTSVTVVVCTLGREPMLEQCLQRLTEQDHSAFDVIVVDNDPQGSDVASLVASIGHPRITYIAEPRRGLSFARNRGAAAATGDIVAFTDDDAVPDLAWVSTMAAVFDESPDVATVTGLVVPMELETPAQHWFEQFASFDKGYLRTVWHARDSHDGLEALGERGKGGPAFPFAAGVVGSGNNMAFRREVLRELGGFDVALGAGTPSGGGEDLDAFVRVMLDEAVIVYEPRAIVHHRHRRELADLETQARAYGSGLSAMLAKQSIASPGVAGGIAVRVPAGLRRLLDPESDKNTRKTDEFPDHLARIERRGFALGPALYVKGRRRARAIEREFDDGTESGAEVPPRTAVIAVDLENLPETLPGTDGYDAAWVVVYEGTSPRAIIETDLDGPVDVAALVEPTRRALAEHPGAPAATQPPGEEQPFASVVVCSIIGRDDLALCLDRLGSLDYPNYEVVLVDNRPVIPENDPLPAIVATRPFVRVVHEPYPGVAAARNTGLQTAKAEIVAFTDDDVRVDPTWLKAIVARFMANPDEKAVMGMILPAELETPAQMWFERYYGGFGGERNFEPLSYGVEGDRSRPWERSMVTVRDSDDELVRRFAVYGAGACGAGANMAFRRSWAIDAGGFDPLLGAGSVGPTGEDIALVMTILWEGGRVGYEPSAVAYHRHRRDYDGLRKQLRSYGVGYTATLCALMVRDPSHVLGLVVQFPRSSVRLARSTAERMSGRRPDDGHDTTVELAPAYPPELTKVELGGFPFGPYAYVKSRRDARRRRR